MDNNIDIDKVHRNFYSKLGFEELRERYVTTPGDADAQRCYNEMVYRGINLICLNEIQKERKKNLVMQKGIADIVDESILDGLVSSSMQKRIDEVKARRNLN